METTQEDFMRFKDLYKHHLDRFKLIDSDLIECFLSIVGDNEAETLDAWELYEELDYSGRLHEIIDGRIDIYNYDLRQWAVDNYNYIEDAIDEGLAGENTDFHKLIQCGQYIYYRDAMNEEVEILTNLINELLGE